MEYRINGMVADNIFSDVRVNIQRDLKAISWNGEYNVKERMGWISENYYQKILKED